MAVSFETTMLWIAAIIALVAIATLLSLIQLLLSKCALFSADLNARRKAMLDEKYKSKYSWRDTSGEK